MNERFLIGSSYFFSEYKDFQSKDIDEIEIIDTDDFQQIKQLSGRGKCLFSMKRHPSKEEYINWALKSSLGMVIGKFLVPEFNAAIGFSVEDLKRLSPLLEKLDDKHRYEEIIFNSYLANGAFVLTQEQRDLAYQSYKESRRIK